MIKYLGSIGTFIRLNDNDDKILAYSNLELVELKDFSIDQEEALRLIKNQDIDAYIDVWGFISSTNPKFWEE